MAKAKRRETTEVLEVPDTESIVVCHSIRLKVVRGPGTGKIIDLKDKPVRAGRDDDVDLYLDDPSVSRTHFEVAPERGEFILRDLGSTIAEPRTYAVMLGVVLVRRSAGWGSS